MQIRHYLLGAAGALGLCLLSLSAEAAPAVGASGDLKSVAREASNVDQVHWRRRCWRDFGRLVCRRYWIAAPYYYDPYPYYPYYYDRPAFGFFFGGHRHHWRHHHW